MSNNSVFQAAMQKHKEKKKEEEERIKNKGFTKEYEQIEFAALKIKEQITGRIYGVPAEVRKNSWDPKFVAFSEILTDNKQSYFKCNWKLQKENGVDIPKIDTDWILARFYNSVTVGKYETKEVNGEKESYKVFTHEGHPVFESVYRNKKKGRPYPPTFYPKYKVVLNWLDRHDNWCKENKHSKILTSKKSEWKNKDDIIYFYDTGIPKMLYEMIMDNVVGHNDHWDLDIVLNKFKNQPFYEVNDILDRKISDEVKKLGNAEPMTKEEQAYEKYDLDNLYRVTSYSKIKKNLGSRFKEWDAYTNGNLYEELQELAAKEKEEMQKLNAEKTKKSVSVNGNKDDNQLSNESANSDKSTQSNEPESTLRKTRRSSNSTTEKKEIEANEKTLSDFLPNWDALDDEDKEDMLKFAIKIDLENNMIIYDSSAELARCDKDNCTWPDSEIDTNLPDTVLHCPVCGMEFAS